jgi:hypothetical protein
LPSGLSERRRFWRFLGIEGDVLPGPRFAAVEGFDLLQTHDFSVDFHDDLVGIHQESLNQECRSAAATNQKGPRIELGGP